MNSVRNVTVVALVVAGAVFLSACGDKESMTGKTAREIVEVGVSDAGCSPGVLNLTAGPKEFEIKSTGSGKVTEYEILDGNKIIAEGEGLAPGISKDFEIDLAAGEYASYCPGGTKEKGKIIVTAAAGATDRTGAADTADSSGTEPSGESDEASERPAK